MATSGLSKLPTELLTDILGCLDSYVDLAACLSSSPIFLHGYLWKRETVLSAVVCRSIGDACLPDALSVVRCPDFSGDTDIGEQQRRITHYLMTSRHGQDLWASSREEAVLLCQLDRVVMRFIDDLVRKAKSDNWREIGHHLPHWADSSFSPRNTAIEGMPRPVLSRAELTRYKLAFLRNELLHRAFARVELHLVFRCEDQVTLLLNGVELWDAVGIRVVQEYICRMYRSMLTSLCHEMQDALCKASQRCFWEEPESASAKTERGRQLRQETLTPGVESHKQRVFYSGDVIYDTFPYVDGWNRMILPKSLSEDGIIKLYNRICAGQDSFRDELRSRDPLSSFHGLPITHFCYALYKQLLNGAHTSSKTFPGPTESWKEGLRPSDYLNGAGIVTTSACKVLEKGAFETLGLAFLDGHIDTGSIRTTSSSYEVNVQTQVLERQDQERSYAFFRKFRGHYITGNELASFQQKYGMIKKEVMLSLESSVVNILQRTSCHRFNRNMA